MEAQSISVFFLWEVKYREAGEEKNKIFDWFQFELVLEFVEKVQLISVVFYATGLTEPTGHRPYGTGRLYEEAVTKDELATVSRAWVEERLKRIKKSE